MARLSDRQDSRIEAHLPLTALVDADGRVLDRIVGAREWNGPDAARLIERAFMHRGGQTPLQRLPKQADAGAERRRGERRGTWLRRGTAGASALQRSVDDGGR